MQTRAHGVLFWAPRVLGILVALFLSLFALDVFAEGRGVLGTILALLIHLIPVYIIVIALVLAWRWEWLGAILFTGLAALYVAWTWGRFPWLNYVAIAGPILLVGVLFLFGWLARVRARPG